MANILFRFECACVIVNIYSLCMQYEIKITHEMISMVIYGRHLTVK